MCPQLSFVLKFRVSNFQIWFSLKINGYIVAAPFEYECCASMTWYQYVLAYAYLVLLLGKCYAMHEPRRLCRCLAHTAAAVCDLFITASTPPLPPAILPHNTILRISLTVNVRAGNTIEYQVVLSV